VEEFDSVRQPTRIVLDSRFRLPASAKLLAQPGRTLVIGLDTQAKNAEGLMATGIEVYCLPAGPEGRVDLNGAIELLGQLELTK